MNQLDKELLELFQRRDEALLKQIEALMKRNTTELYKQFNKKLQETLNASER